MNILHIAGRLGRDPEKRFTASGQQVTNFTVAVNYRKGGKEEATMWIRVTVWGDRFDKLIAYLKKGSAVMVVGEMHPPSVYTDKEGRQQVSLDMTADMIKFSPFGNPDRPGEEGAGAAGHQAATHSQTQAQTAQQTNQYEGGFANAAASQGPSRGTASNFGQQASRPAAEEDNLPF